MGKATGFINGQTGLDIGTPLVDKSYLIDRYPELVDTFKTAGLWLWGNNNNTYSGASGMLGTSDITDRSSPVQTISGGTNWKQVSCGSHHTAAIKTDGTLWLWGGGANGSLGNNAISNRNSPVQTVASGTNWKQVSCGYLRTAAIKTDGTLWLWGVGTSGQLGDNTAINKSSPVQTISGGTNWKQVSCGSLHTAAIKTDGTLWLWGSNQSYGYLTGALGVTGTTGRSSPIQTSAGGTNWKSVVAGNDLTAAIKTNGTLWTWGNNYGTAPTQFGTETTWSNVYIGGNRFAGIKTNGTLWFWGNTSSNSNGQFGNGSTTNYMSPVQTISQGTNWKDVSLGSSHTTAIKTDGSLWTWGSNFYGELGNNTTTRTSSPIQTIAGGTNWKQVSSSGSAQHTAAIRDDSTDPL